MIIKEKIIFLALLPVLIGTLVIGMKTQETKKKSTGEFLKDIESVTEKAKAKKKAAKDSWDIDGLKKQETMDDYLALAERDIFSRPVSEVKEETKGDIIPLREEPKKPLFVYKGRMTLGARVIVIIEDQNTGKSFSVKEGDSAGEFIVVSIGDKEVLLRKNSGEEIVISTAKEEKKEEKEKTAEDTKGLNEKK
ncbi:MAG: hypothetical protein KKB22_03245 [Candidatus Omnitrophica bacterium]|nr:hypothetical protein [Candidatus Omnitrophota bacterium]